MDTQAWRYQMIAKRLRDHQVIAYPTEGVWGLGCLPESETAVFRLLQIKQREWEKGLILIGSEVDQFVPYVDGLTTAEFDRLAAPTEYPVTYLVPKSRQLPFWVSGKHPKVAIRVSNHPTVVGITTALGQPVVSTSANPNSRPAARNRLKLQQYFAGQLDYIVPGELGGELGASEIRDLLSGKVLRAAVR